MGFSDSDVRRFCNKDIYSAYHDPWVQAGHTFATDGQVLVKFDSGMTDDYPTGDKPISHLLKQLEAMPSDGYITLQKLDSDFTKTCVRCKGKGELSVCPECDGEGELTLETDYNEYDVECKSCSGYGVSDDFDGSQTKKCSCDNGQSVDNDSKTIVDGVNFKSHNLAKFNPFSNVMIKVVKPVSDPSYIKFDGGVALIMALRGGDENHV
jgi:hypothetical protein